MAFTLWRWPFWRKKPQPRMTAEEVERLIRERCRPGDTVTIPSYCAEKRRWHAMVITHLDFEELGEVLDSEFVHVYDETGEVDFWQYM